MTLQITRVSTGGTQSDVNEDVPMRKPERTARTTPTILNCGGSVTSFAAAEVVAEAVAETVSETVLLEVDIGSKQVQAASAAQPLKTELYRFGFDRPALINFPTPLSRGSRSCALLGMATAASGPPHGASSSHLTGHTFESNISLGL